jgi:shikimate O-hydroxycinnamoyltransferase
MEVQILSRKLIAPSSPTPPHLQNLKVSCFDQLLLPFTYHAFSTIQPMVKTTENEARKWKNH